MINFRSYLKEHDEGTLPLIVGESPTVDINDAGQREQLNFVLSDITEPVDVAPEVSYERVRGVLSGVGFVLPPVTSLTDLFSESEAEEVFVLLDGGVHYYLYFAFVREDSGATEVIAEIVEENDLEEILNGDSTIE